METTQPDDSQIEKRSPRRRLGLILLTAVVLLGGIYFASKSGSDPDQYSNDFNVYYFAAREVAAGRDPYQNSLGSWTTYLYPPLLSELLVPLSLLPLPAAAYLWFLISASSIAAAAWMSASLAADGAGVSFNKRLWVSFIGLAVLGRFVLDNLSLGQVNNVVAALAVAHIYLQVKRRPIASAAALAIAVSIKLTPALLIVYQIARLRLKFAALCIVMLAGITLASFIPFGQRAMDVADAFIDRTIRNEQGFDLAYSGNQSLRGALLRLRIVSDTGMFRTPDEQTREPIGATALILSSVMLILAVVTALRAREEIQAAAPFFCCMVLISPLSWKAHFVALILPVIWLVAQAIHDNGLSARLKTAIVIIGFVLFNVTSRLIIGDQPSERVDELSLVFLAGLFVFLAALWTPNISARRSKPEREDSS